MKKLTIEIEDEIYETLIMMAGHMMWETGKECEVAQAAQYLIKNGAKQKRKEIDDKKERDSNRDSSNDGDQDKASDPSSPS